MSKDLKDKAINIKGKQYVLVADRVIYFNEEYPNGAIQTDYKMIENMFIVTAVVIPDTKEPARRFIDHSQAVIGDGMVNKTAALENASTSAVGRALSYMGIGVIDSIASVDEINKATGSTGEFKFSSNSKPSVSQLAFLLAKSKEYSGLNDREQVLNWFKEKTGLGLDQVKKNEVDGLLKWLEDERDV